VVTSFDSDHRLRLLRVLQSDFKDWQVLLLTHERIWFEMIKKEMSPAGWLVKEVELVPNIGIRLKSSPRDLKEAVAHKKSMATLVPNDLRNLTERILKEICYCLEVKTAFRFNDENERRMPGELLSELRSTLKKKSSAIKDDQSIVHLETSNLISTTGSHDSGPVLSPGDIDVCYTDILNFDALFCCAECKNYVAAEKYVDHLKKIYCTCGKKSLEWKD